MSQLALARKWRPRQFNDLVGQQHVVTALVNALTHQKLHHAYLLTGTRGVGKTTIARIFAKCLNCEQGVSATPCGQCNSCEEIDSGRFVDLFEIDAASRTKVEDTRDLLDNVQYAPSKGRYKVYLIDEVHMLSGHSFNALLKTLEEPPEHVKFILATTDPEKLPATVLSRCLQFHLLALLPEQISTHLKLICEKESIPAEEQALMLLAQSANGSLRDALSLLDQAIAFGNLSIKTDDVRQMLGTIDPSHLYDLLDALHQHDGNRLYEICHSLVTLGSDFSHVLADLVTLLHQISVLQLAPGAITEPNPRMQQLSQQLSGEDLQLFYQIGLTGQRDMALAPSPRVGFEMTMMRMLAFYPAADVAPPTNTTPPAAINKKVTEKPESVQNIENAAQTPAKASPTSPLAVDWANWVGQMKLTGAALLLAQNCSIDRFENDQLHLSLDPLQKPLLQKKYQDRLNDSLNQLHSKTIALTITLAETAAPTPNTMAADKRQQQHQDATKSIHNDKNVKTLMDSFDAKIVEGSIVSKQNL
ncbi:MAG: DNA polymerase III subunit gamma/tau [Coxiellaceae bacterium]|nr:DNA polymerase III subunit gamma/tau [Coxiellaceae bacterium]